MKIVVDDKIPYIKGNIEKLAEQIVYLPGSSITSKEIKDADALVVRTRTRCDKNLLEGSQVKFIATATIGYDHIDTAYCEENGIYWTNAVGCNSSSVAQYLHSSLILLQKHYKFHFNEICLGIVGLGNVGSKVYEVAESLGIKTLLNDPPLQEKGVDLPFVDLETIKKECDMITFHVPLIKEGEHTTYHLGNELFFNSLQKKPVIINTSRGEVIETKALLNAMKTGKIKDSILDVWEDEPTINLELLEKVFIGTPHIAGYSADGKANATRMSLDALAKFFHLQNSFSIYPPHPQNPLIKAKNYNEAMLEIYNPLIDSQNLKNNPKQFEFLREHYPLRREKEAYTLSL